MLCFPVCNAARRNHSIAWAIGVSLSATPLFSEEFLEALQQPLECVCFFKLQPMVFNTKEAASDICSNQFERKESHLLQARSRPP
jgi:hypothetical protein